MRIEGWRCGFSTIAISVIISGAANKILLKAFTQVQVTYNRIAEQRDFSNFHPTRVTARRDYRPRLHLSAMPIGVTQVVVVPRSVVITDSDRTTSAYLWLS